MLNECFAVDLRRLDQSFGRAARVVVNLRRGVFCFSDDRRRTLLGFDEMISASLLSLGEDLRAALLGLGGDSSGLFVSGAKDRGALGAQCAGQGGLVKGGIGRAPLGLDDLILQFTNATFEVTHFAGYGFEVEANFVGVDAAFAKRREVHPGDLGRRLTRWREGSAVIHIPPDY